MANNQMESLMSLLSSNPDTTALVANVIFESTNYAGVERPMSKAHPDKDIRGTFGHEFNRKISEDHVKDLVKVLSDDIQKGGDGFMSHLPILLSAPIQEGAKAKIIDGQHRFEALCRINEARALVGEDPLPFYYTIHFSKVGVKDIAGINSSGASWRLSSYVEAYAKDGNEAYQRLIEINTNYGLPYTAFTEGRASQMGVTHLFTGNLKNGTFKFLKYDALIKFLDDAKDLVDEVTKTFRESDRPYHTREIKKWKLTMTYRFVWSLYKAYSIKGFDKTRFRMKLLELAATCDQKLLGLTNTTGSMAEAFLLIYNNRPRDNRFAFRAKDLMFSDKRDSANVQDTSFDALQIVQKDIPR